MSTAANIEKFKQAHPLLIKHRRGDDGFASESEQPNKRRLVELGPRSKSSTDKAQPITFKQAPEQDLSQPDLNFEVKRAGANQNVSVTC